MRSQAVSKRRESRTGIIEAVKTPLGFFVLVVLVVEALLGIIVGLSEGTDRTLAIVGMLGVIGALILVVAVIAFFRPKNLDSQPNTAPAIHHGSKPILRVNTMPELIINTKS